MYKAAINKDKKKKPSRKGTRTSLKHPMNSPRTLHLASHHPVESNNEVDEGGEGEE